ncbi:S8 family peptidase [Flammeovirga yaeyamensis]|uniref:S8 family peptidase n=1 Tax=Flammeovirga yaeyamensis TaxID=367791 RepID=A0AAX1N5M3_9BACT|nr:S8 family peptidase [Flammeovirga yaeyamensis]QWG02616.1 S8 family peptidase [Flammeovirga yaeyamensis]
MLLIGMYMVSCTTNEEITLNETKDQDLLSTVENNYVVFLKESPTSNLRKSQFTYLERQELMNLDANSFASEYQLPKLNVGNIYGGVLNGFSIKIHDEKTLDQISNDPRVLRVIKDQIVTLAKPSTNNVSTFSTQTTPWGISRVNGGISYSGNNVAYVMDTGIDLDHPDLNVNESIGFNAFRFGRDGRSLDDFNSHGTHVAGTIAAINNQIGVIGVAAGATVVPVKVLNSRGSGSYSGIIAGIDFVGANGRSGDVANLSLGGGGYTPLDDAVEQAAQSSGVKFILAAGNESQNANNVSPARANGPNVYTISASDINDNFASFSNYGSPVDWCAPGVNILSTVPGGRYASYNGTSMAAPHAAGVYLLGAARASGSVNNDPDGNPDPIISR